MTSEQITTNARRVAEVLFQVFALLNYTYKEAATVATNALIEFIVMLSKRVGSDADAELMRFFNYINAVRQCYEREKSEIKQGS